MKIDERDATEKSFDCVAFMREARSRLSEKMNSMGSEEFWHWMHHHKYSDPRLAKLAGQGRPSPKEPGRTESEGA